MTDLTNVDDGECPLCRHYNCMVKLRENGHSVTLVDVRNAGHPAVRQ